MAVSLPVAATMYASCAKDTLQQLSLFADVRCYQVFVHHSGTKPCLVEIDHETILDLQEGGISVMLDSFVVARMYVKFDSRSTCSSFM